jgi:hypothetical protein
MAILSPLLQFRGIRSVRIYEWPTPVPFPVPFDEQSRDRASAARFSGSLECDATQKLPGLGCQIVDCSMGSFHDPFPGL